MFGPGGRSLDPGQRVSRPCRRVVEEVVDALKRRGVSREAAIVRGQLREEGLCEACWLLSLPRW